MSNNTDKKYLGLLLSAPAVTMLLPIVIIYAVGGHTGMALMVMCLMVINPLYFICVGLASGGDIKKYCGFPVISVIISLIALRVILGVGVSDLTFYLVVYLLCAVIPMLIRTCIKHNHYKVDKKEKNAILAIMFVVIAILVCAGTLILI